MDNKGDGAQGRNPISADSCGSEAGERQSAGDGVLPGSVGKCLSPVGTEEGAVCGRDGCAGIIHIPPVENCSCHINPPCIACTENLLACPECGWEEERIYTVPVGTLGFIGTPIKRRPLDPTRIDWRSRGHTHFTMIKEGVYPEGTTREEVLDCIGRGTFGGRFSQFGGGTFRYIAYTD